MLSILVVQFFPELSDITENTPTAVLVYLYVAMFLKQQLLVVH